MVNTRLAETLRPCLKIRDFTADSSKIQDLRKLTKRKALETHHKCRSEILRLNEKFPRPAVF